MTAEILQFRDYQHRQPTSAIRDERTLEQQAIEITNIALMGAPTMVGMEPVVYLEMDTAPSEYCAPSEDSA